jgi:polyisoprenoid-binding protein YceI
MVAEPTAVPAADAAVPTAASSEPAAPAASAAGARTFQIVPEQTEASYEVQEQFLSRALPNKAIGKTNAVTGEFQFSTDGQPNGEVTKITVDLRTLTSDSSRRDGRIRTQWLESETYPFAEFTSTEVQGLPASYTEGQEVSFKLVGDMTIREVTRPVTFEVVGKLQGDTVTGTATTQILMKDFGFDPPSIAGMLTVEDGVTIKVDFTAKETG